MGVGIFEYVTATACRTPDLNICDDHTLEELVFQTRTQLCLNISMPFCIYEQHCDAKWAISNPAKNKGFLWMRI